MTYMAVYLVGHVFNSLSKKSSTWFHKFSQIQNFNLTCREAIIWIFWRRKSKSDFGEDSRIPRDRNFLWWQIWSIFGHGFYILYYSWSKLFRYVECKVITILTSLQINNVLIMSKNQANWSILGVVAHLFREVISFW